MNTNVCQKIQCAYYATGARHKGCCAAVGVRNARVKYLTACPMRCKDWELLTPDEYKKRREQNVNARD